MVVILIVAMILALEHVPGVMKGVANCVWHNGEEEYVDCLKGQ
jgi:competence protein ComGC